MFGKLIAAVLALSLFVTMPAVSEPAKTVAKKRTPPKPKTVTTKELAKRIDKALADPELQRGFWGVHVVDATSGKPIYELNADRLFTPASNTKLFTTATAFAILGPKFTVDTTVETNGALEPTGKLKGDLFIVGRGDPNLSGRVLPYVLTTERQPPHLRAFEQMADALVGAGLKEIDGDVVGDDTYFSFQRYGAGWGQDDLMWLDGAPASALTLNDNVIFVNVLPGNVGEPAKVAFDPDVSYYEIENRVTTIAAHSGKREIGMNREPGSKHVVLWGAIPADDAGFGSALAIEDPGEFAAAAFKEMLEKRGVQVHGKQRVAHTVTADLPLYALDVNTAGTQHTEHGGGEALPQTPPPTAPARTVLTHLTSRPLFDDLMVINKVSQNLHAEIALRWAGKARGTTNSLESALAVEKELLISAGLDEKEFKLYDGSGMSMQDLVTPRAVTKLLAWTRTQPWAEQFRQTLPIAGVDGSLDTRFRDGVARGRIWAKTGTLNGVSCLSGFAETESGRKLIFSVLVNHAGLSGTGTKKVIDHVLELLIDDQTGR